MNIPEKLDALKQRLRQDEKLKERILATRKSENPLPAFCKLCRELG